MNKATITLEPLSCPSCLQKIESATRKVDGVDKDSVRVMFNSSKVKVKFTDETSIENIEESIEKLGYPVIKSKVK